MSESIIDNTISDQDIDDMIEFDEENSPNCDVCGGTGMRFEGDVHVGDCVFCCGGTL